MPSVVHPFPSREFMFAGSPAATSMFRESFPNDQITTDCAIGATSLITAAAVYLFAGDTISKVSVCVGATAGATLSHKFGVLYSGATTPALLASSADDTGSSMAANTVYTATFSTAYVVPTSGLYWAGICISGTTIPTLLGKVTNLNATAAAALNTLIGGTRANGVSVTATGGSTTAPATMASLTQLAVHPYVLLQ